MKKDKLSFMGGEEILNKDKLNEVALKAISLNF